MTRKLWLSIAALAVGAGLLVAAGFASPASSGTKSPLSKSTAGKTGGTLKINLADDTDYIDPALDYYTVGWELTYATAYKLLNYPDKEAPEGSQLQPEAAAGFPTVSADGKTYTFTIKPGAKFNDGKPVTAANFAAAINRDLNPKMQSPAAAFISGETSPGIAGAKDVLDGKATTASGVIAKGNTLTIKLTAPNPSFLAIIAMPFFAAIPTDLQIVPEGVQKLASAGPYYITNYVPNRTIELARNPNYKGDRPHNVDKIVYTVGVSQDATLLQVKQGTADYAADGVASSAYADLAATYGVNKSQFQVRPTLAFRYLALNQDQPLFKNNVSLRRAVNYAIDRPALLRQYGAFAGKRTDQYLPPGMPGFKDANLYPLKGADVESAKKLATGHTGSGTAVLYTNNRTIGTNTAQIVQYDLKQIGIDVQVKQFSRAVQFSKEGTRGEVFDIGFEGWGADYADPFDFINILLDGNTIHDTNNVNFSYFNDPAYNKKMADAAKLSGAARYAAYGNLDIDIANHASPLASFLNQNDRMFLSARVGCFVFNPVYQVSLSALCLK